MRAVVYKDARRIITGAEKRAARCRQDQTVAEAGAAAL
jgi:hypothetical protein